MSSVEAAFHDPASGNMQGTYRGLRSNLPDDGVALPIPNPGTPKTITFRYWAMR